MKGLKERSSMIIFANKPAVIANGKSIFRHQRVLNSNQITERHIFP